MAEYLALDWDDQRLVGVAAQVGSKHVDVRAVLDFTWAEGEMPSEQPVAAGKRLRAELDKTAASNSPVIVSLPREEAIVRLLELPDCSDDELPELVRFQAVTRSAVPLEKLLLDYLPLPSLKDVAGRRVWMATIARPVVDRVQTLLKAAGLEASAIRLSSLGAAELVAHQPESGTATSDLATLIVSCVDLRIEITAIWQNRIVLMHAATLSSHDPPEAQLSQILAETARSTVALSQAAPGLAIGSGWLIGSRADHSPLATALDERFGFKFHVITDPSSTRGVTAESCPTLATTPLAWAPLGLLVGQSSEQVDSVDFLHPRRQHPKPDRRKLYIGLGGAAAVLVLIGIWIGIQRRVWQLDNDIANIEASNRKVQDLIKKNGPLMDSAGSVDEWTQRDIDWLDQFRVIEQAKDGPDKLYLTMFDANVATRDKLAVIVAAGRAKLPNLVDDFEDKLVGVGYRVTPKEISEDTTDPQYPVKIDLNLEILPKSATDAKGAPAAAGPAGAAPSPSPRSTTPAPSTVTSTVTPQAPPQAAAQPAPAAPTAAPAPTTPPPTETATAKAANETSFVAPAASPGGSSSDSDVPAMEPGTPALTEPAPAPASKS